MDKVQKALDNFDGALTLAENGKDYALDDSLDYNLFIDAIEALASGELVVIPRQPLFQRIAERYFGLGHDLNEQEKAHINGIIDGLILDLQRREEK